MRRRVYLTLAVVTGLLAAASAVIWAYSESHAFGVVCEPHHLHVESGVVSYGHNTYIMAAPSIEWYHVSEGESSIPLPAAFTPQEGLRFRIGGPFQSTVSRWAGFELGKLGLWTECWYAAVPLWFPTLLWGLACGLFLRRLRLNMPIGSGHCAGCGYDLRAGHERCPECGAALQSAPCGGASA